MPLDLVDRFGGRKEIIKALGTSDPAEAKRRLVIEWRRLDHEFVKARASLTPTQAQVPDPASTVEQLSPTLVSIANLDRLRDERDKAERRGALAAFMQEQRDTLTLTQAMLDGSIAATKPMRELEGLRNGLRGFLDGVGAIQLSAARKVIQDRPSSQSIALPLEQLRVRWAAEQKPTARTAGRAANVIQRFEAATSITEAKLVKRSHVQQFLVALISGGSSPANANAMLNLLKAVLSYGVRLGLLADNPAKGINAADVRRARGKRRSFTAGELNDLFKAPVHAEGRRPQGGGGEAAYWLPLMALYTGARLNELGQLYRSDIYNELFQHQEGGEREALVVRLTENAERNQTLKNEGSERRIPIHNDLIHLGLLDYLSSVADGRLFPDLVPSVNGELTANWSNCHLSAPLI